MIVLDTNIVSEVMGKEPSEAVIQWLNEQDTETLYLTTITIAEIGYGLRILPDGRRKRTLRSNFNDFIAKAFGQRILDFDEASALVYAEIMGHRKEIGRPMSVPDGQIASIARSKRMSVATRNTRDFEECGIHLINPFL